MDGWSDGEENALPSDNPGAFRFAMEDAYYGPLGELTSLTTASSSVRRSFAESGSSTAGIWPTTS